MNLKSKMIHKKNNIKVYIVRFYVYIFSKSKLNYIVVVALLIGKSIKGHRDTMDIER